MTTSNRAGEPLVRVFIDHRDRHWWLTAGAAVTLAIAATMAIFGLPPVDLHGPLHKFGIMDPLCGGTRAARYVAQANLVQAWRYNPLSILVVVGSALAVARATVGIASGRWLSADFTWTPKRRRWVIGIVLVLVGLLEIRQQMRAELLMQGTQVWR